MESPHHQSFIPAATTGASSAGERTERLPLFLRPVSATAMERSLGKRSPKRMPWTAVEMSKLVIVNVEMAERVRDKNRAIGVFTSPAYQMVAIAASVIGNVYAHHVSENL